MRDRRPLSPRVFIGRLAGSERGLVRGPLPPKESPSKALGMGNNFTVSLANLCPPPSEKHLVTCVISVFFCPSSCCGCRVDGLGGRSTCSFFFRKRRACQPHPSLHYNTVSSISSCAIIFRSCAGLTFTGSGFQDPRRELPGVLARNKRDVRKTIACIGTPIVVAEVSHMSESDEGHIWYPIAAVYCSSPRHPWDECSALPACCFTGCQRLS